MAFELPSLPKTVVIHAALISAILLSAVIAIVGFWTFLPLFMDAPNELKAGSLEIDFAYIQTVTPGMNWNINGTAHNPSDEAVEEVKIRVYSDGNIQGYEYFIPVLGTKETVSFVLKPKIKESASLGEYTSQTVVSVPGSFPAEYELRINIV